MRTTVFFLSIISSVGLTSCMESQAPTTDLKTDNVSYFHDLTTKTESSSEQFNRLIKQNNVIVDFYAEWCGPCKSMSAIVSRLAPNYPTIKFIKINIDQFPELARSIKNIPTFVFYKNGQQIHRFTGVMSQPDMVALIQKWY